LVVLYLFHNPRSNTMYKQPIHIRIVRFISNYPNATHIPVHPEDYYYLLNNNMLHNYKLPIVILGTINK